MAMNNDLASGAESKHGHAGFTLGVCLHHRTMVGRCCWLRLKAKFETDTIQV